LPFEDFGDEKNRKELATGKKERSIV